MTEKTPGLMELSGHSYIEINTADAEKAGIHSGERIRVSSRRGTISSEARVSDKTNPGECWMPFHFLDGNANWLTNAALDSIARAPEYKVCAVRIEKIPEAEAYDEEGNYITQAMLASKRFAEYMEQMSAAAQCSGDLRDRATVTESNDDCSKRYYK
ncbi:MAG: hypothetical protein LUD55_02200 [Oscillospiraceae bacterium]|nr:hypothetical protein [Oscillospiraceae bacterium]